MNQDGKLSVELRHRVQPHEPVTADVWEGLMMQWLRRNAEASANLFVVNATTPAQVSRAYAGH